MEPGVEMVLIVLVSVVSQEQLYQGIVLLITVAKEAMVLLRLLVSALKVTALRVEVPLGIS